MNSPVFVSFLLVIATSAIGSASVIRNSGTIRVHAKQQELSKAQAEYLITKNAGHQAQLEHIKSLKADLSASDGQSSSDVQLDYFASYMLIGDVDVGTPAQTLRLAFDRSGRDLYVFDVNAKINNWPSSSSSFESKESVTGGFNHSASTTYTAYKRKFKGVDDLSGYLASDIVNIGGLEANLTFGDANIVPAILNDWPIGGFLGLSLAPSRNNISNVLNQLAPKLDKPLYAMHFNRTTVDGYKGSAEIALGTDQLDSCKWHYWQYIPLINPADMRGNDRPSDTDFGFHVSAVSAPVNGVQTTVSTNRTIIPLSYYAALYVSNQINDLFLNASGAVYNATNHKYQLPCDQVANAADVTLSIGNGGQQLVLTPSDYIFYDADDNSCSLYVYSYYDESDSKYKYDRLYLGQQFLNNHCVSYNFQEPSIGFTDSVKSQ